MTSSLYLMAGGNCDVCRRSTQGCQICIQIVSDWPQMGQIWDFLRSVSVHFGAPRQNVLKLILKSPRFVLFGANLSQFGTKREVPVVNVVSVSTRSSTRRRYVTVSLSL